MKYYIAAVPLSPPGGGVAIGFSAPDASDEFTTYEYVPLQPTCYLYKCYLHRIESSSSSLSSSSAEESVGLAWGSDVC